MRKIAKWVSPAGLILVFVSGCLSSWLPEGLVQRAAERRQELGWSREMVIERLVGLGESKIEDLLAVKRDLLEADKRGELSATLREYLRKIEKELARRAGKGEYTP